MDLQEFTAAFKEAREGLRVPLNEAVDDYRAQGGEGPVFVMALLHIAFSMAIRVDDGKPTFLLNALGAFLSGEGLAPATKEELELAKEELMRRVDT